MTTLERTDTAPDGMPGVEASTHDVVEETVKLSPHHLLLLIIVGAATLAAVAAPFPITKLLLGAALAPTGVVLLLKFDERFVGLYVLMLPTLQLVPIEALGVTAFNWQTLFLLVFGAAAALAPSLPPRVAATTWIGTFSVLLVASAFYAWLVQGLPFSPVFQLVKNWLFPFMLFVVGRRYVRDRQALWFLVVCVALVSVAQSLHALRGAVSSSNLVSDRPGGMLTGQPNLFAGYLAIYGLVCLFAARAAQIRRPARLMLSSAGLVLIVTLIFTLSRGAWMAFIVTTIIFGAATNRRLVLLLVVALALGYRWIPEAAVSRTETTLDSLELSGDSSLEDSMDASAALRIIQWKSFPEMFVAHPIWGTGLNTYASQLGQINGIFRSPHSTIIEIGTEMGALGLMAYLGLLISTAYICIRRAYSAPPRSLERYVGLGVASATVCLFLLDFTGTRSRAHTVTTYFWLLVGAFLGATDDQRPAADDRPPSFGGYMAEDTDAPDKPLDINGCP